MSVVSRGLGLETRQRSPGEEIGDRIAVDSSRREDKRIAQGETLGTHVH